MKKPYYLLALLLTGAFPAFSQQNFKPGYIVTSGRDTVKGFIDHREWRVNPGKVQFRKDQNAATADRTAAEIAAFGVDGMEAYRSYTVSVSNNTAALTDANVFVDTTSQRQQVFLKILVDGDKLSLYSYTDAKRIHFYAAEPGNTPVELIQGIRNTGNGNYDYNYRYRAQLIYYAQHLAPDHARIENLIAVARYDEADLIRIVRSLNSHVSAQAVTSDNSGSRFFAGAGLSYTMLKFIGDFDTDRHNAGIKNKAYPMLSLGVDIFTNNNTRRVFGRIEAGFTAADETTFDQITYHQTIVFLDPQVGANFYNTSALKIYATIGLDLFKLSNTINTGSVTSSAVASYSQLEFKGFWLMPNIHAGATVGKKLDIFLAYVPPSTVTNGTAFNAQLSNMQVGLHYVFDK